MRISPLTLLALVACGPAAAPAPPPADPLPSWRAGGAREAIVRFVDTVTTPGSPAFVPPAERIAVFDNDGTLWSEQPIYVQAAFILDRVRAMGPAHPEWRRQAPLRAVLDGDTKALVATGEPGLLALVGATHAGLTGEQFADTVSAWIATARHPVTGAAYPAMAYQPMLELLAFLRARGFQTWIVSGGGVEFMRAWVEGTYGIPPSQVIGSTIRARYAVRDGVPVIERLPELEFNDDKAGKPLAIHRIIGRRPIAAFGNSDGDFEMLEWVTAGAGARLGLLVHHDDGVREPAYDRDSPIGRLARALDEAPARGWVVASVKGDWTRLHPGAR
jgi:phosphoglycolate phosphatase-like HAD superfamily hydrolase